MLVVVGFCQMGLMLPFDGSGLFLTVLSFRRGDGVVFGASAAVTVTWDAGMLRQLFAWLPVAFHRRIGPAYGGAMGNG